MKSTYLSLLPLVAATLTPTASAATITFQCTASAPAFTRASPTQTFGVFCPQFDPSQGTLSSFNLVTNVVFSGTASVQNASPNSSFYSPIITLSWQQGLITDTAFPGFSFSQGAIQGSATVSASSTANISILGGFFSQHSFTSNLSDFSGLGTIRAQTITAIASIQSPNTAPISTFSFVDGAPVGGQEFQIVYTYSTVPEVSSASLLAIGSLLLIGYRTIHRN